MLQELVGQEFIPIPGGFVRLIDYMGNDDSIAASARVSYAAGTKKVQDNEGLLRYLMRHQHTSPFEFAEIILHMRAPLYIARQLYRHRTANVNEISGRYSILNLGYFLPEELKTQSNIKKQCRSAELISNHDEILELFKTTSDESVSTYNKLIQAGVARETARGILPLSIFTEWRWKIDLHNLLRFLKLRLHHSAQSEMTKYAEVISQIVEKWVPKCYKAFCDYQLESFSFSKQGIACLQKILNGKLPEYRSSQMSPNEWNEFVEQMYDKFQINLQKIGKENY